MPPRSRATRNQDAARSRQGVIDLDPTDGLPVQRYILQTVNINQDASADPSITNPKSTNSLEWQTQFGSAQYPWQESPLPTFYKEIPSWNQEMIRRARTGNTKAKLSVWDRREACWISAAEAEKRQPQLKSLHLNNLPDEEEKSEKSESEAEESEKSDESEEEAMFKRKRKAVRVEQDERLIEVKKWVQVPVGVDEVDRTFLAKRRAGMPALYQPEYATKLFGRYHSSSVIGAVGYDLGEGGGLNNASGVLAVGEASTPKRNVPPRRKKKKLGGPGRRKANPVPVQQVQEGGGDVEMQTAEVKNDAAEGGDESGSEAEGSEEGEIDESGDKKEVDAVDSGVDGGRNDDTAEQAEIEEPTIVEPIDQIVGDQDERKESIATVPSPKIPDSPQQTTTAEFIPGLGSFEEAKNDPEEKEIIEETAKAIALTDEPGDEQIEGVSEAITEAAVATDEPEADPEPEKSEFDLLGAMDAAIDQDMKHDP